MVSLRSVPKRCERSSIVLALAFALAVPARPAMASDAQLDAAPAGLTPTTVRLATILADHDKAVGNLPQGMPDTVVEKWTFVDGGLAGTEDLERSGRDYRSTITSGPFVERFGQHGDGRWHQDANGFTSPTTAIDERSFYAVRVLEEAADPKNDVTVLGVTAGEHPAYVLQVKQPGRRHPEWVFYDKATAQVVRLEFVSGARRVVQTYDDFRTIDGVATAWHVHDTDGRPELDDDYVLQTLARGTSIPAGTFDEPSHQPAIARVTAASAIPAQTHLYGYVVRMMVNGRGLDFLLDSASPASIIDRDVAAELGLPTYGQTTHTKDGAPVSYLTTIADGDVGPIHLHDFALRSERFIYEPNENTKVVGLLGYDFFAANVLRFDFVNGTLAALPVLGFEQAHPVDGGVDVPLNVDDGTPFVTVRIGDTVATHSVLDTAMPFSMVFGAYVASHEGELQDARPGIKHHHAVVPFDDDGTFGSEAEVWPAVASNFIFATTAYPKASIVATTYQFSLHDASVEAIVGMDYMDLFDVYFDYPNGRLILRPNKWFFEEFKPAG